MLPVNMLARYHVLLPQWGFNSLPPVFPNPAFPILSALNAGDACRCGSTSRWSIRWTVPLDVLSRMPVALQRRLLDDYATIQLADSVSALSVKPVRRRAHQRQSAAAGPAVDGGRRLQQREQLQHADRAPQQDQQRLGGRALKEEEQTKQFLQ